MLLPLSRPACCPGPLPVVKAASAGTPFTAAGLLLPSPPGASLATRKPRPSAPMASPVSKNSRACSRGGGGEGGMQQGPTRGQLREVRRSVRAGAREASHRVQSPVTLQATWAIPSRAVHPTSSPRGVLALQDWTADLALPATAAPGSPCRASSCDSVETAIAQDPARSWLTAALLAAPG